ncbi:MAG: F0F1 ATP synthase subunit B [Phycisphaera sp.]|nr:F0F1 ATP synthase subunit B [Phycisphaera sp.]
MVRNIHMLGYGLLAWATPALVFAAEHGDAHGGGEHEAPPLLDFRTDMAAWTLILFVLVIVVLGKFVWPQITSALDAREAKIRGEIADAEAANAKAQKSLETYEAKLAAAQAEVRAMLDQAKADAEAVRVTRVSELEKELAEIRQRATAEIDSAKQSAVQELHAHAAELAVAVASKILQRKITADDTQRLVDESLKELDDLNRAG